MNNKFRVAICRSESRGSWATVQRQAQFVHMFTDNRFYNFIFSVQHCVFFIHFDLIIGDRASVVVYSVVKISRSRTR